MLFEHPFLRQLWWHLYTKKIRYEHENQHNGERKEKKKKKVKILVYTYEKESYHKSSYEIVIQI